jgi:hypothetical protein
MYNGLFDLPKLNTLTKYPSIPTYHKLEKGVLGPELNVKFDADEVLYITEKIDGTNGRIILLPDGDYLIGSREELLTHSKDLIHNPALGIVEALTPIAVDLSRRRWGGKSLEVYYFEVYGGNIGKAAKQYSREGLVGARCFDAQSIDNADDVLGLPIEQIAAWRDGNNQDWRIESWKDQSRLNFVPSLARIRKEDLPLSREDVKLWLECFPIEKSRAVLDESGLGNFEGVIVHNLDRSKIVKIRVEDYVKWSGKRLWHPSRSRLDRESLEINHR